MPGPQAPHSKHKKALEDLFSCIGAGDVATAGALLNAKSEVERAELLSATNAAGVTLLMHACHAGHAQGVSMLLDKVRNGTEVEDELARK